MTTHFSRISQTLQNLLEHEISCARNLLEILEKDHSAIVFPQVDLSRLNNNEKQKYIIALQEATETRVQFMTDHQYDANAEGIRFCISELGENEQLVEKFNELSELAQWCFKENRLIGQLINRRTQFINQALVNITPGCQIQSETYDESGSRGNNQQFHRSVLI